LSKIFIRNLKLPKLIPCTKLGFLNITNFIRLKMKLPDILKMVLRSNLVTADNLRYNGFWGEYKILPLSVLETSFKGLAT